jgi:hypothetical protein
MPDIINGQELVSFISCPYEEFPSNLLQYVPIMSSPNWPSSRIVPFKILYVFLVSLIRAKYRVNPCLFNLTAVIILSEQYNYECSCLTSSDNKVRELASVFLPWQQWIET